ncbi:MAG: 2-C-methyl-D-erythritol 2,4-cyclodiphosphate synthase [Firmicutes bacterium RBG_13_65_8]|nr:MAG: 2-C-methyl-D-erythritol 2,4-cyclodiphosphate synthase [Firmicutes bacterium RBG_13_65_8]
MWLRAREAPRTGIGFDIHPLGPGQGVRLGGVDIPCPYRLEGYSDADVVAHAAMDAILGAAAMGDIGGLYPPGDPQWSGADSIRLLSITWQKVGDAGYELVNLDVSVVAEVPRLSPHFLRMRAALATALGCDLAQVNVKATTCEALGALGRREGIAALATATIRQAGET